MKKAVVASFLIFSLTILSGCLTTLYPIFFEKDLLFEENLIGLWKCTSDKNKNISFYEFRRIPETKKKELPLEIQKASDKAYLVSRSDSSGQETEQYFVFLATIGKSQYLDFYPAETPVQYAINKYFKQHYVKVHTNYRCDMQSKNQFIIRQFDSGFLENLIEHNQINVRISGTKLIESPTKALQEYILKYGDDPKAYYSTTICTRILNY